MWAVWAQKLLTADIGLAKEIFALLEKRWRNGRSPQPRDSKGRFVKRGGAGGHTPNVGIVGVKHGPTAEVKAKHTKTISDTAKNKRVAEHEFDHAGKSGATGFGLTEQYARKKKTADAHTAAVADAKKAGLTQDDIDKATDDGDAAGEQHVKDNPFEAPDPLAGQSAALKAYEDAETDYQVALLNVERERRIAGGDYFAANVREADDATLPARDKMITAQKAAAESGVPLLERQRAELRARKAAKVIHEDKFPPVDVEPLKWKKNGQVYEADGYQVRKGTFGWRMAELDADGTPGKSEYASSLKDAKEKADRDRVEKAGPDARLKKPEPKPVKPVITDVPKVPDAVDKPAASKTGHVVSDVTKKRINDIAASLPKTNAEWLDGAYGDDQKAGFRDWKMPSEKLLAHELAVRKAGAEFSKDFDTARLNDETVKKLRAEIDALEKLPPTAMLGPDGERLKKARKERHEREQAILLDMLGQVRGMGGNIAYDKNNGARYQLTNKQLLEAKKAGVNPYLNPGKKPSGKAQQQLADASNVFPSAWHNTANKERDGLLISELNRAQFSENPYGGPDLIFLDRTGTYPGYTGGFKDYPTEVAAHEMGHRFERTVPGLRALEFALHRRRSSKNGVLESPKATDKAHIFADDWAKSYSGKSYEYSHKKSTRPATSSWEVFQTGLQDVFGRNAGYARKGDSELSDFVLGSLLTLGR